ncbi:DUF3488 and transglutaminase-like domain-containing protein [soil metagenome]
MTAPAPPRAASQRAGLLALSALIFLLLALPVGGLAALLSGDDWWWSAACVVAIVLGIAGLVRLFPVPAFVSSVAAVAAWAVCITVLFAPGESLFGFLPTFDTFRAVRSGLDDAAASIAVQSIPADPVAPIVLLIALSVGLLAVLADAVVFVLRMPALAGLASVAVFSVPYAVNQQSFDVWLFASTAAVYLLLLWLPARLPAGFHGGWQADGEGGVSRAAGALGNGTPAGAARRRPERTGLRALLSGALAILVAIVLPSITPGLTPESFRPATRGPVPSVYSSGVDPSIQLSRDLRRSNPVLALNYTSSSSTGLYLKLVTLSDLRDGPWQPETAENAHSLDSGFDAPYGLAAGVATATVTTSVSVSGLRSDWLPLPYPATGVSGLNGTWTVTPGSLTVTGLDTDSDGQNYSVSSLVVSPTAAQLAASGKDVPAALAGDVALPVDIAPVIRNTAQTVTAAATTPYDEAVALQRYFTSGAFQYSVTAPVEGHYDGGNFAAVATFLSAKSGYCIHFASAMAVMARTLGIPSRIAIGYHPGQAATHNSDGTSTFDVFSDQLHAWPELWFEGVGWLAFEPTPGLGIVPPDYSLPDYAAAAATPARDSAGSSAAPTTPKAAAEQDAASNPVVDAQSQARAQGRVWLIVLVVMLACGLAALTPAALRRARRRRRLSAMMRAPDPASVGWREVCDTANDYRLALSHAETARAFAARLGTLYRMPPAPVANLLGAVERERFSRDGPGHPGPEERAALVADVRAIIRAISAQASTADDRRAVFLPRSLLAEVPLLSGKE